MEDFKATQHLKITWILTCILTSFTVTQAKLGLVLGSQHNTRIHVVSLVKDLQKMPYII